MVPENLRVLDINRHGPVREIRLNRPPANALNAGLVKTLATALEQAAGEADAVVISGMPGMFSAGLDVPALLQLDRNGMLEFWSQFNDLMRRIAFMPIPVAFALTGHAPAGGIVLALYGDCRIMSSGNFKTGLNEWKKARTKSDTGIRVKNLTEEMSQHPFEIGESDAPIHHETFHLMEHRRMRGIVIVPIHGSRNYDLERRLAALHGADLHR